MSEKGKMMLFFWLFCLGVVPIVSFLGGSCIIWIYDRVPILYKYAKAPLQYIFTGDRGKALGILVVYVIGTLLYHSLPQLKGVNMNVLLEAEPGASDWVFVGAACLFIMALIVNLAVLAKKRGEELPSTGTKAWLAISVPVLFWHLANIALGLSLLYPACFLYSVTGLSFWGYITKPPNPFIKFLYLFLVALFWPLIPLWAFLRGLYANSELLQGLGDLRPSMRLSGVGMLRLYLRFRVWRGGYRPGSGRLRGELQSLGYVVGEDGYWVKPMRFMLIDVE